MGPLILNVDDFDAQRYTRSSILRNAGFEVIEAAGGGDALRLCRERHPDLVLLDVHLPDIDGREVCRRLKADPVTAATPILHISATFRDPESRAHALDNGADAYLAEPVEPDELAAQIRAMLRLVAAEGRARQAEQGLRASEERLRLAQQVGGVGTYDWNPATGQVIWSRELEEIYGLPEPADGGHREAWLQLVHLEDRERLGRETTEWLQSNEPEHEWEYRLRRPDGQERWIHGRSRVLRDASGRPARVIGTNVDVTERKRVEQALRENENRLAAALGLAQLGVWEYDVSSACCQMDARCREVFGFAGTGPFSNAEVFARVHPDDRARVAGDVERALATRERYESAYRVVRPDGRERWITARGYWVPRPGGAAEARFTGTLLDVTEREETERELERREREARELAQELESLYDSAPIGLCIFDREGRFLRINQRLAEINGPSPEAHVGRTLAEIVPGLAEQAEALLRQVFETGRPVMGVELAGEVPSQPGVRRTWIENWHPVKREDGSVVAVSVAAEEITERKRIEEELRQANRLKDEFLATLSHELRTPLTAILGWASMLDRGLPVDLARKAVEAISRNAEVQRTLVNDVLDVSRIVSGKIRLQLREVDLVEIVGRVVESMQPAVAAKQLHIDISAAEGPSIVSADPERLQQIAWNLLSNAVKFTESGGRITVSVVRQAGTLLLHVADTGIGIPAEYLPYVFDRFSQADGTTSRRHGGLGLGLAIVRHLAELHGGRVSASSEGPGKGATFTVALPIRAVRQAAPDDAPAAPERPAEESTAALDDVRVLVVDDLEDARALVSVVVETAGGSAVQAASAAEALEILESTPVDAVVADIGMPGVDGYEFVRRLRAKAAGRPGHLPVIALTAYGGAGDRAKALAGGFDEHLPKPVLPNELVGAISQVLRARVR